MDFLALITGNGLIEPWGVAVACIGLTLAGFIDAIAGGGGLISTPAFLIAGLPIHTVIATNKLSNCMGTAVACAKYIKEGFMRWRLVVPCIVAAMLGSTLGAHAALAADENLLRIVMLVVIPVAGFYVLRNKQLSSSAEPWEPRCELLVCLAVSLGMGFYDGFYGPGTGAFLMLLLTSVGRLKLTDAAGTTKAVNLTTNVSALVVFLLNGAVMIPLGLLCGLFNVVGSWLGARLFTSKGAAVARPVLLAVLVIFAARVIAELLGLA